MIVRQTSRQRSNHAQMNTYTSMHIVFYIDTDYRRAASMGGSYQLSTVSMGASEWPENLMLCCVGLGIDVHQPLPFTICYDAQVQSSPDCLVQGLGHLRRWGSEVREALGQALMCNWPSLHRRESLHQLCILDLDVGNATSRKPITRTGLQERAQREMLSRPRLARRRTRSRRWRPIPLLRSSHDRCEDRRPNLEPKYKHEWQSCHHWGET